MTTSYHHITTMMISNLCSAGLGRSILRSSNKKGTVTFKFLLLLVLFKFTIVDFLKVIVFYVFTYNLGVNLLT